VISGCALVSGLVPPIPIELGANSSFQVTAGMPTAKTLLFPEGFDAPVAITGGSFNIDPSAITVNASGPGKRLVAAQTVQDCQDVCDFAGVDTATCNQVCQEGDLIVTAWVGTVAAITADCKSGEDYRFEVTLNVDLVATGVSATPSSISSTTRALLDSEDGFGLCLEVISPVDGEVIIDELSFRVQL
jgi:hypothetical protein